MNDKKALFETTAVPKALMTMAVPTIVSQLINLIYNMVDTIYIGRTGNAYMTAAVTLAFTIFMMTVAFANLFGIGGGSLMARLIGKGTPERAKCVCAFAFYGAAAIALTYSLLIGVLLDPILRLLGASENTMGFARQYVLIVVVAGNLPTILSATTAHLLRNAGYSKQASFGLSMGGVLNIVLDPLFMFVLLPKGMEVAGAAIATLLSNVVSCVYLIVALCRLAPDAPLSVRFRAARDVTREEVRELFAVGVPSAALTGLFDVANIFLNSLTAGHGDLELAAVGIVMKAERLPNAVNLGICQGMLPMVAYSYASGDHTRMNRVIHTARLWGLCVSALTITLFELLSPQICRGFLSTSTDVSGNSVRALAFAARFLRVRCLAALPQFLNYSTSFCMQAVGYGKGTLLHACVRELVFYIPLMYLLDGLFGMTGLISALPVGELCGGLFALWLFARWKRRNTSPCNSGTPVVE